MTRVEESDALHARVVRFGRAALEGESPPETFEVIARDVAAYQYRFSDGFRRLVDARGGGLGDPATLPAVPTEAFRLTRVATHPPVEDAFCFVTSGTTGDATGWHPLRRASTYASLAVAHAERTLRGAWAGRRVVVALCPEPGSPVTSSLGFMIARFMEAWDGRPLDEGGVFDVHEAGRWLASAVGIDVAGLRRAADVARGRGEPLVVAATGFALVLLLDALDGECLPMPERTVVMLTGGFKGRTRSVEASELIRDVARAFAIDARQVVGEYGMTELSSQLYEGVLPGAACPGPRGVFSPAPWLRVSAVDPASLDPVADGDTGLARFVDLVNVDSAVCVVTQDLVRVVDGGVELLGRQPGATARGCSLALEQMVL